MNLCRGSAEENSSCSLLKIFPWWIELNIKVFGKEMDSLVPLLMLQFLTLVNKSIITALLPSYSNLQILLHFRTNYL